MPLAGRGGEGAVRPPVEAGTRRGDSDISLERSRDPRPFRGVEDRQL